MLVSLSSVNAYAENKNHNVECRATTFSCSPGNNCNLGNVPVTLSSGPFLPEIIETSINDNTLAVINHHGDEFEPQTSLVIRYNKINFRIYNLSESSFYNLDMEEDDLRVQCWIAKSKK